MTVFEPQLGHILTHKHPDITGATRTVALSSSGLKADYYCDGVADNVEIQAAVTASAGGSVYIRGGTYDMQASVGIPSNTMVFGDGRGTVLKHFAGTGFNGLLTNSDSTNGNTGIIIRNLSVDGNKANVTGSDPRDSIYYIKTTNSIVENCYILNGADSAIVLDQSTCTNNIIKSNLIDGCTDIGIYISVANQNTFIGNQVFNTGSYGIRNVNSGAIRNVIVSNYVYNCGQTSGADGILVSNGDGSTITANVVYGSGRYGIQNTSPYVTITGNNVIFSDQHGIYLSGAMRCEVSGNTVHQSGQDTSNTYSGIYLNNGAECAVVGNRSGDTGSGTRQKYGIEEAGTSNTNIISSNMCQRNATGTILVIGAATEVGHNI